MRLELADCHSARAEPDRSPYPEKAAGRNFTGEIVLYYEIQIIIFARDIKPTPAKIETIS